MKNNLKNKKIVMLVVNDFTHDSRVLKEALSAKKAGMKVWVIARKSRDTKFREIREGIKINRVQTWVDRLWAVVSKNKGKEVAGSQSGETKVPKKLVIYTALFNIYLMNKLFIREVGKMKPHLIHANDSTSLLAACCLKKEGYGVVYDAHELYSESNTHPDPIWKAFYVWVEKKMEHVDGIFSVCQSILDELDIRYNTKQIPKAILYNAPFYCKKNYRKSDETIKLLYVGNYSQSRNFKPIFNAVKMLKGVTLTNLGPGWPKSHEGGIINLPPVSPQKVVETISKYDIGVIPYVGDNLNHIYSTPNKIFEYMMAGLAIVASDLPEIRRIVTEANNGALFNPRSAKSIAKSINLLINDPKKLAQYKQNSLEMAKKYCWENQEQKQLKLYEKILQKTTKVFLGPLDSGLNKDMKEIMEKQGYKVTTCDFIENDFHFVNDINLRINKVSYYNAVLRVFNNFINSLSYEIYNFRYGQSLLPWNLDLPILKILRKKIIMVFDGSDLRQIGKLDKNDFYRNNIKPSFLKDSRRAWRHYWVKIWADKTVVATPDLLVFAPEAEYVPNLRLYFKKSLPKIKSKNITILHTPSNLKVKGTDYLVSAVKKLKHDGFPVKLLLMENITHKDLPNYYQKADIVVDQLLIGAYGVVSIEAMMSGKTVICYIRDDLKKIYPSDLPIISANPDTIYNVLKGLISHPEKIRKYGLLGPKFIKKNLNPELMAKKWKKIWGK